MRFSEAYSIRRTRQDDWFDPHLTIDTKLFVDPLLLFTMSGRLWAGAHDELITHFAKCYELVARAASPTSNSARMALRLLTFPEPHEFGLGYTARGTRGSGAGRFYARAIMDGIAVAIAAGLGQPEHIEEIGILNERIGADRISDATCNVLKQRFIQYTQAVARRHSVPISSHRVRNAEVVPSLGRWRNLDVELPTNPKTGGPVILVPEALLDDLPILNADDWFNSNLNEDIRTQLNIQVSQRVAKEDIVRYARRHPDRVRDWARTQTSRPDLAGYDFEEDRKGVVHFDGPTIAFADAHPITEIARVRTQTELLSLVTHILDRFAHFIAHQRGWSLLWNSDGSEKPEEAAQLAFLAMSQHYLRLFDVEVDREVELGRGPADFKLSRGTSVRLIIEIKKAHNGKFWHGLERQLPAYLTSDDCRHGWFVAIRYRSNRASEERMRELPSRVRQTATDTGKTLRYSAIDGRPPDSASNA